ncbi:GNAT family N-acetyltransferase [Myxococcota bacterium]|nr:GNAT family N-acetyltransferase [Myxococcota bacterium]
MGISIHTASTAAERERIFAFRYAVHAVELGKGGRGVDHDRRRLTDEADDAPGAVLLYAEDDDRLVGTIRVNFGGPEGLPESLRRTYGTHPLEDALGASRLSVTSRFMVDPAYRGRTLASLLVLRLYGLGLERGTLADFCMCEVPLLRLYYRLGYREYRDALRPDGIGLRVPLILTLQDRQHLARVESPFTHFLPEAVDDRGRTAGHAERCYGAFRPNTPLLQGDLRTLWAGLADALTRSVRPRPTLLDGFGAAELDAVFARGAPLHFHGRELVQPGQERRTGLGVILSGSVGVGLPTGDGHHFLEILRPGDVFGESSPAPAGGRVTDLVALEPTRAVMLPPDLLERLERDAPALAFRLAHNLVTVLRQRVDDLHMQGAEWMRRERRQLERDQTIPPACTPSPSQEAFR